MGMRTGVVATSRVVQATPAAFAVSNVNRRAEHEIAAQFLNAPLDLILAGGTNQFLPEEEGGEREDGRDITAEMQERGFSYFDDIGRISETEDRKSTRLNSSHVAISYAVFCLKKKKTGAGEEGVRQ